MSHLDIITDQELDQLEISLAKWEKDGCFTPVHELLRRAVCTIKHLKKEMLELSKELEDCQDEL